MESDGWCSGAGTDLFYVFPPSCEDEVWRGACKAEENRRTWSGTRSAPLQDILSGQLQLFVSDLIGVLDMLLCFSCLVLTLIKVRNELENLQEQIAITDDPKRLTGDTKIYFSSIFHLAQWNARHLLLLFLSVYLQSWRGRWRKSKPSCSPRLKTQRERFQTTI